ncbi:MAG TPA: carboxypeptidase-like regulatory domain-containing protein [Thermoanaerobaculia bacterium]|nr:carboxypeptidase-like regulatory domain-containing protein [Thermoanaerobaculia bacterium]
MPIRRLSRRLFPLLAALGLAAAPAPSPLTVTGTVLRGDGSALAGARVEIAPLESSYEWGKRVLGGRAYPEPAASAETDAAGRFTLAAPGPGLWTVGVQAPGFLPLQTSPLALPEPVELPPAMLQEGNAARVRVVNPDGTPAAGVWIYAASESPAALRSSGGWAVRPRFGRTGADGAVDLVRGKRERLTIQAVVDGAPVVKRTGMEGGPLTIPAPARVARTIEVRGVDGRPVPGVHVRIGDLQGPAAATGPDGRARLLLPPGPPPRLRLLAEDGRRGAAILPAEGDPAVLVLPPAASVSGRAIDAVTRQPLAGALVWLSPDPGAFVRTDARGAWRLAAIETDAAHLQAEAAGHLSLSRRFPWQRESPLPGPTLALDPAAGATGVVVSGAGKPLPGTRVQAVLRTSVRQRLFSRSGQAERRTATGPDGRFRLDRLLAGETWEVRATLPGHAPSRVTLTDLAPGKVRDGLRIVLGRGRTAFGRVVDRSGKPVPGADVSLAASTGERAPAGGERPARREANGLDAWAALSDPAGRFTIPALPEGKVDLKVGKSGFAPVTIRALAIPPGEGPFDLGTVILEPGAEVRGIVTGRDGRPVEGAEVHAARDLRRLRFAAQAGAPIDRKPEAVTGADGRFAIADLRKGDRLDLWVRAAGHRPGSVEGVAAPNEKPVRIVLDRGVRVAGRVVDAEKRPVPGANLSLRAERPGGERGLIRFVGGASASAVSDEDGRFALEGMTPGSAELNATAAGFQPAKISDLAIPEKGLDNLEVVLERGAVIEGRVLTAGGDAVEDARVVCGDAASVSDADGAYRLDGVPLGAQKVRLLHRDYPPLDRAIDVQPGVNPLDLVLPEGHEVAGRVVDRAGKPVAGAELALFPAGSPREQGAVSGADGDFRFPRVADGAYTLRAEKEGYLTAETANAVTVAGVPVRDVEVRLDRGTRIAGRLLGLDLYDLAEVDVRARRDDGLGERAGRVDYEGKYEIPDVGPGDWVVTASLRGGTREARGRVLVEPGAEEARLDLEFGRSLTLTGRILYGGEPLPGAAVTLRGLDVSAERQGTADWEGAFRFEDVKPGGYRLQVLSQRELLNHSEELRMDSDRDVLVEIAAVRVSGTVADSGNGEPIAGAIVALRRLAGAEAAFMVAIGTDAEGYFALPAVTEGPYRMTVTRDGYSPHERQVEVNASANLQEMKIPLDPAAGLDLDVRFASGGRPPHVTAAVLDASGRPILFEVRPVDASGRARFPTVPAGSWEVLVSAPGAALASVPARVPGGPVPVVLRSAGRLTVRVPALASSDQVATLTLSGSGGAFRTLSVYGTVQSQWAVEGGKAIVEGVPAGTWSLTMTAPDGKSWSGTATTAGADQEVVLN